MKKIYRLIKNLWRNFRNKLPKKTVDDCKFHTGELIAFSGDGLVSWGIKMGTMSRISHVGVVLVENGVPWICESTTLTTSPDGVTGELNKGVQKHLLKERIAESEGEVYHYRLKEKYPLYAEEVIKEWCADKHGQRTEYDSAQAILSGFDMLDHLPKVSQEDLKKLFCSEMYAKITNVAWKKMYGYEPIANPSKENPAECCDYFFLELCCEQERKREKPPFAC